MTEHRITRRNVAPFVVRERRCDLRLVGGPLIMLSGISIMIGLTKRGGAFQAIATIPEFFWELLLGIYCVVRGFQPSSPILTGDARVSSDAAPG